jgi:hypothetical protein
MQHFEPAESSFRKLVERACLFGGTLLISVMIGCGGVTPSKTVSEQAPQTYFAPFVASSTEVVTILGPSTFTIDDSANTISQTAVAQQGPQVVESAGFAVSTRGLLSLGTTTDYSTTNGGVTTQNPGGFAVELTGQAGGLVQLVGKPAAPLVAATQCPNLATPQTYQFISIPAARISAPASTTQAPFTWDPAIQTAYGSVDISSNGSAVNFNIKQFTLPPVGGSGAPTQGAPSSATGACGPTFFGNTVNIPGQLVITDPGGIGNTPPQATLGIGPTGLLVEDNGVGASGINSGQQNVLGAGTGAIGLPRPSSPIDTSTLTGAQYLGFAYGAGIYPGNSGPTGWSSHLVSFGFSASSQVSCAAFAAQTGVLVNGIYGGDFPQTNGQDDPSGSPDGFGNCDLAVDLGTQDTANNGLFPKATVWIRGGVGGYGSDMTGKTYSFPAVAIAGQLNGENAIFLIGVDSTTRQPWAIYLLQSK